MDKAQAIHKFWNSFGIPAYDESTVPSVDSRGSFYITYEVVTDSLDRAVTMQASLWDVNTTSWKRISQKADEISKELEQVKSISLNIGFLYVTRGQPFAQRMSDEDERVRRIIINVMAEFLTP